MSKSAIRRMWVTVVTVLGMLALAAPAALAADLTVTNTNDSGAGSLRDAIEQANSNNQADTITFTSNIEGTITLTSGELLITDDPSAEHDLTIKGPGAQKLAVSGNDASRVLHIGDEARVAIEGLTLRDGKASGTGLASLGGGILNDGALSLTSTTVRNNWAVLGGGIVTTHGDLTLTDSTVSNNEARDGIAGIHTVTGYSSGIDTAVSTTTIRNSTISGNTTAGSIGGIFNQRGPTVIENSTITNNFAGSGQVGGVGTDARGTTEVFSSIISGNIGGDVFDGDSTDVYTSRGYNVIGSGDAVDAFNATGDQTGVTEPKLGPLEDNGGPTFTHLPFADSPAVDKGKASPDLPADQRGTKRPQDDPSIDNAEGGDGSDAGAVERGLATISVSGTTVTEGTSGTTSAIFAVRLSEPSAGLSTVDYATEDDTAAAPGDYAETSGTLSFSHGETFKEVTVPVEGDALDEFAEGFFLNLSNANGTTIVDSTAAATIRDDDPTPSLSINDVRVTEDANRTTATFAIGLSSESGKAVIVDYSTADGTAVAPDDYVETSGTAYFRPGVTERYVTVAVKSDISGEPNENFFLKLLGAENATVADNEGEATILDSRPAIELVRPADGTSGVSATTNVEAAFSKEMNPSSVNSSTFELRKEGSAEVLSAAVRYDATYRRAILDPSISLLPGTSYVATIKGGPEGAEDTSGKGLEADKTWSFSVAPDQSAPRVVRVTPAKSARGISPTAKVTAVFSEAMNPTTLTKTTFKLYKKGSTTALRATVRYDAATKRATLDPNANLERGATYKAVLSSGAEDLSGNALDQNPLRMGNQRKVWFFTIRK